MTFYHADSKLAWELGAKKNAEVFYFDGEGRSNSFMVDGYGAVYEAGWYWWPRFEDGDPGDPEGPFDSEGGALDDARSGDWWYPIP
jgi:hypothetical protein